VEIKWERHNPNPYGTAWHGHGTAWAQHGHGMASVNQTRPLCVNQMGKTHSKSLAAWHGRERRGHGMSTVWAWHEHGMGTA